MLGIPDEILYDKEDNRVRTIRVNTIFDEIEPLARVTEQNKKGNSKKNCLKSSSVPRTGIEPAHSCERQILSEYKSLIRLNSF